MFTRELILKGAVGLAVVGGLGVAGVYLWNQNKEETLGFLTSNVGLSCTPSDNPPATTGVQCNKKDGSANIKVKHDDSTKFNVSTISTGNIKVYKVENSEDYNKDFKFVIEDNDISENNNKLEQFETYEIKQDTADKKYYLTRKNKALKKMAKILGIPDDCNNLGDNGEAVCSSLNKEKLKAIKFEGKGDSDVTISDEQSGTSNINLKISKTSDNHFPRNHKFTLESDKEISIPQTGSPGTPITIKKNTNTEFKLKVNGNNLTLERAWDISSLGKKIGLTECGTPSSERKCKFGSLINVYEEEKKYVNDASINPGSTDKKISYEENVDGYNQGFKFTVEGDITLESGTTPADVNAPPKILKDENNSNTYEIKEMTLQNNETKWYLVKIKPSVSG